MDIPKEVETIVTQVAIARKAVVDRTGAAAAGFDTRGVWIAAANVCADAVIKMDALVAEQNRQDIVSVGQSLSSVMSAYLARGKS